jgi:hypothetical protein
MPDQIFDLADLAGRFGVDLDHAVEQGGGVRGLGMNPTPMP